MKNRLPITSLIAQESSMAVSGGACDSLAERDTKHPASDDSDTL